MEENYEKSSKRRKRTKDWRPLIGDRLNKIKLKPADRGKWKRGQNDHWIGEKIKKRRFEAADLHQIYFISQDREKKGRLHILGKQRTN